MSRKGKKQPKEWLGFHFVNYRTIVAPNNRHLSTVDGERVVRGRKYRQSGEIVPCRNGLHASKRLRDAYEHGGSRSHLCRVRLSGVIVENSDKAAASERTVLWIADVSHITHSDEDLTYAQVLYRLHKIAREMDAQYGVKP